jgi:hypothetical protein
MSAQQGRSDLLAAVALTGCATDRIELGTALPIHVHPSP